jgi:hypothetical protein
LQFYSPQSINAELHLNTAATLAYKEVITSLEKLLTRFKIDKETPNFVQSFIFEFKKEVKTFIYGPDFEQYLASDETIALRSNKEKEFKSLPKLIMMLSDLIIRLCEVKENFKIEEDIEQSVRAELSDRVKPD